MVSVNTRGSWLLAMACLLSACAPPPKVAVEERDVLTVRQETEKMGGQLIRFAQPGDTLHAIAFIARLDVNKLAAWNGIQDTSKLNVGQRIRLTKPIGFRASTPSRKPDTEPNKQTGTVSSLPSDRVLKAQPLPTSGPGQVPTHQPDPANGANISTSTTASTTAQPPAQSSRPAAPNSSTPFVNKVRWRWPANGNVVTQFSVKQGQQGIDIQGERGQSVMATDRGEVVYVGNSLKGYGKLIIVKHSDEFLSAYAHNQSIFVREGQVVSALQKIGSIGANNRRQNALHFQIRKKGKPVNPLLYLPKI